MSKTAIAIDLRPGTLMDYADSNSRYALMSGLLTLKGNKLAISESKIAFVENLLADGTTLIDDADYLQQFYSPFHPKLPSDDEIFIRAEILRLSNEISRLSAMLNEQSTVLSDEATPDMMGLHAQEARLRKELRRLREIEFYRDQSHKESLQEIEDLLEDIRLGNLIGGSLYAPAYFEWAVWRLFLAINQLEGEIHNTRGFNVDDDLRPVHHARSGSADLTFTYSDFALVCEMTLTTGSRQFAAEGEPVTRHVFKEIGQKPDKKVYGLFVAGKLDPNTVDAFHNARYWKSWQQFILTPVVAVEIDFCASWHIVCKINRFHRMTFG
ncbi:MAG: AlwI family type II restriction endonuclease [Anaerolineae bacterium]|nr:AlwI family type II restriction endonuclease [Anaerolineae bacterium]